MQNVLATIDFEATALSKDADIIEVGVAIYDRHETIRTWSSLVRPRPTCLWSDKSAALHKISMDDLKSAPEPFIVAADLNRIMTGIPTAYCDGYEFDIAWMGKLFRDGKPEAGFSLAQIEEMPRMHLRAVQHHMRTYRMAYQRPHRAGPDAVHLMQAYAYALGKKPSIVVLP